LVIIACIKKYYNSCKQPQQKMHDALSCWHLQLFIIVMHTHKPNDKKYYEWITSKPKCNSFANNKNPQWNRIHTKQCVGMKFDENT